MAKKLSALTVDQNRPQDLFHSTLHAISNIFQGEGDLYLRQALDDCDMLSRLHAVILLEQPKEIRECMFALSNIAAHSDQTALLLIQDDIFATVVQLMNSTVLDLRKEAVFCVTNVLNNLRYDKT